MSPVFATNGGLSGVKRTTTTSSAPGIWMLEEQALAKRAGIWPVGPDPNFSSVSLLLRMDGSNGSTTFTDSSSNAFTVTANGSAEISTAQSKFGGASGSFNGSNSYLNSAVSTAYEFGTGDFTVETWAYFNSVSGETPIITLGVGAIGGGSPTTCGWSIRYNSSLLNWYRYDGTTETSHTASWSPSTGAWYHIAACRSGTSLRLFIDGTQIGGTITTSQSYDKINSDDLFIGRFISGVGTFYLNGYIDELRITKGVARYTANFIAPTAPFPSR